MNIIYSNLQKLLDLCRMYKVVKLYVFGSILTNKFNRDSDIDLLVDFDDSLDYNNYADNFFNLTDELELLLGRKVDLVDQKSIKNPFFKQEVLSSRQLIYG